jgi:hypothetical protein
MISRADAFTVAKNVRRKQGKALYSKMGVHDV